MGYNFSGEFSGAFSVDLNSETNPGTTDGSNIGRSQKFIINANLSNAIYGNSDTVQPLQ